MNFWQTEINQNDKDEDTFIKKFIANINYGLLEKGGPTNERSLLFRNLSEAVHYQTEYGGKIHRLTEFEVEETTTEESDSISFDDKETEKTHTMS